MDKTKRPIALLTAAAILLINGVMALVMMFTGHAIDILALCSLLVAVGIFSRKSWARLMLQILAVLYVIAATLITLSYTFPFNGTDKAYIGLAHRQWEISPIVGNVLFLLIALFYAYAAFSDTSRKYFSQP